MLIEGFIKGTIDPNKKLWGLGNTKI